MSPPEMRSLTMGTSSSSVSSGPIFLWLMNARSRRVLTRLYGIFFDSRFPKISFIIDDEIGQALTPNR